MTTTQTKSKILSDNWALKMFIWAAGNIAFQKARNNINKGKDVLIAAAIGGTAGILEDICSNTINHGKGFGSGVVSGALSGLALASYNFYLRTKDTFNYNEYAIDKKNLRFKNYFLKNADKYSAGIDVKFYPAQLYDFNESMKVAYLAIALGHELFIHDTNLKIVSLWNQSRYEEAWNLAVAKLTQKTDDHTMYMAGNKPQMNNYITQLKSFVRKNGSKFNVTEQDIKTAVELHNKTYKR